MGDIAFLAKKKKRPDKDETGKLRASTDLYYQAGKLQDGRAPGAVKYCPSDRVMLQLENITQDFGGLKAVSNLSFALHEHEILSIIGPNGAGKTTLFNLISGIYPPTAGTIEFEGAPISGLRPHKVVKAGIARTFQNLRLFNQMSVLDNARVGRFCRTSAGPLAVLLRLPRHNLEEQQTDQRAREILAMFGARLPGYRFDHWNDAVGDTNNVKQITMNTPATP